MASWSQNQEGVEQNHLNQQLAVAVRSIQWSYAIFWSISTKDQGGLEWGAGYYNGDIKTRKTLQPMEFNANQYGLQRSEQLRDLYESLSIGESTQQPRRPSASLSPEDLSDAEWYYLVCMSFTFTPGQGLPGKALASGQHIWLSNAHRSDNKVFIRSLLAKSASIQTVLCFPFLGGVIELGVTESILEDLSLLQHVKTALLEFKKPTCSEKYASRQYIGENDEDAIGLEIGHEIQQEDGSLLLYNLPQLVPGEIEFNQNGKVSTNIIEDLLVDSPNKQQTEDSYMIEDLLVDSPNKQQTEDSYMMDGINGGASQVESWQFMDDDLSNGVHGSVNSSELLSQTFSHQNKSFSSTKMNKLNNLDGLEECDHTKLSKLVLGTDNVHYSRTLSAIFKTSNLLIGAPCSQNGKNKSSFDKWEMGGLVDPQKVQSLQTGTPQKMLKKVLFEVAFMHGDWSLKSDGDKDVKNGTRKPQTNYDISLCNEKRTEELNEKFTVIRSLVPSGNKVDEVSLLDDTIDYLKELERRVEELESCKELTEFEPKERKYPDIVERTSDNYGKIQVVNAKKTVINKRKACDIDELMDSEPNWALPKDSLTKCVTVGMIEKEILIEISCPWKECLLLEVMDLITELHLEAHSVQSSSSDGVLTLNLKSKFKGAGIASPGSIKQAIQRVIGVF